MYLLGFTVFLFLHHILLNLSPGFHLGRVGLGLGPNLIGRSRSFESFFFLLFFACLVDGPKKKRKKRRKFAAQCRSASEGPRLGGPSKSPSVKQKKTLKKKEKKTTAFQSAAPQRRRSGVATPPTPLTPPPPTPPPPAPRVSPIDRPASADGRRQKTKGRADSTAPRWTPSCYRVVTELLPSCYRVVTEFFHRPIAVQQTR